MSVFDKHVFITDNLFAKHVFVSSSVFDEHVYITSNPFSAEHVFITDNIFAHRIFVTNPEALPEKYKKNKTSSLGGMNLTNYPNVPTNTDSDDNIPDYRIESSLMDYPRKSKRFSIPISFSLDGCIFILILVFSLVWFLILDRSFQDLLDLLRSVF